MPVTEINSLFKSNCHQYNEGIIFCHFLAKPSQDFYILDITDIIGCVCNDLLFKRNMFFLLFVSKKGSMFSKEMCRKGFPNWDRPLWIFFSCKAIYEHKIAELPGIYLQTFYSQVLQSTPTHFCMAGWCSHCDQ